MDHNALRCACGARTVRIISVVLAVVLVLAAGAAVWLGLKAKDADERQQERASAVQRRLPVRAPDGQRRRHQLRQATSRASTSCSPPRRRPRTRRPSRRIKQSYEAAKVKGTGKVLLTAVGDSDDDSATVLVVHDASVKTTQGNIDHHYRWSVDVVKVNGEWLVDDFNPVN